MLTSSLAALSIITSYFERLRETVSAIVIVRLFSTENSPIFARSCPPSGLRCPVIHFFVPHGNMLRGQETESILFSHQYTWPSPVLSEISTWHS